MQFAEHEILAYYPLVVSIAKKTISKVPFWVELDDIISAGVIGLLDAVQKFDSTRGNKFNTYAYHRIWGSIMDELRAQDPLSRRMRKKQKDEGHLLFQVNEEKESDCLVEKLYLKKVREAIEDLIPSRKMVVFLRYYLELEFAEIGMRMGVKADRIRQMHIGAISNIRDKIGSP